MPDFQGRYLGGSGQGYVAESLPNITGSFQGGFSAGPATGAFRLTGNKNTQTGGSSPQGEFNIDASRSSSTYQDGAKVRPDTLLCNLVIKF